MDRILLESGTYGYLLEDGSGVLDLENIASGAVTGAVTSTGAEAGTRASFGTTVGSVTSTGSEIGRRASKGTVTGSVTSSGSVSGVVAGFSFSGSVVGSVTSSGSVAGSQGFAGSVFGSVTASGQLLGFARRFGSVSGSVASSGTVVGRMTYTLSGTVTAGGTGLAGAIVTVSYVGRGPMPAPVSAVTDALGAYALTLAAILGADPYKLFVQTNAPGYPDQWLGGSAAPTVVVLSGNTVQDIALVALFHVLPPMVTMRATVEPKGYSTAIRPPTGEVR